MRFYILIFVSLLLHKAHFSVSQSTVVVYSENFNSGPGGWVIGGYQSSWSYGIPSLPNIASNGTNCFTTGDAGAANTEPYAACLPVSGPTSNGNYYNCCERSYVESPVINLTGINAPMLSLDINLYCEQTFDGAKVQISLNGGLSWQDVGSYSSSTYQVFPNALNCREQNWYNKNNINYLNGTSGGCGAVSFSLGGTNSGWSGGCAQAASGACTSNDIHGTNGWVTATHCIPQAANQSSFKLRIGFGSGSQVYSDGIAFDNVKILDVYPVVDFSASQAAGCGSLYEFTNTTDCGQSWNWNFGHPNLPGNTSTDQNPVHEFPAAGNYTVTLTATDYCGGSVTFDKLITANAGNAPVITAISNTGTLLCDSASGSVTITLAPAGTPPYSVSYQLNNSTYTQTGLTGNPIILTGMYPGTYGSFSITDANGCVNEVPTVFVLPFNSDNLSVEAYGDTIVLPGEPTPLLVTASIPSTFEWTPASTLDDPDSPDPIASPLVTTSYTVTATDTNGCVASSEVTVFVDDTQPCNKYFFPNSFTPNGDGKNEKFSVQIDPSLALKTYYMQIFDRWGSMIFESNSPFQEWDGGKFPQGSYVVKADFECTNKKKSSFSGTVRMIR